MGKGFWYVHSIFLVGACGSVLMLLLVVVETLSMFGVGGISQAGWG